MWRITVSMYALSLNKSGNIYLFSKSTIEALQEWVRYVQYQLQKH